MTIVVGKNTNAEQAYRQMYKIVEVIKITKLTDKEAIIRDLALLKIELSSKANSVLKKLLKTHGAKVVKKTSSSITVEICGTPQAVDKFISACKKFGILEVSRTGATAISC